MIDEPAAHALITHLRAATFTTAAEDALLRALLVEHADMAKAMRRVPALERAALTCPSCGSVLVCPMCGHNPGAK